MNAPSGATLPSDTMTDLRALARSPLRAYAVLAAFTFALQFALVAVTFPLSGLAGDVPLFHIDGAYHWYNMKVAANLAASGRTVGFDPFFDAGFVNGVHYYVSGRLPALLAALLSPGIDEIRLYKGYVFLSSVLAPLCIVGAAAAFRLAPREAWIAAALGIALWWVSYLRWYFTAGMVGYVTTCYLTVLLVSLIIRELELNRRSWVAVGLGILGAFCFYWHQLFPIPVAIGVLAYLAVRGRELDYSRAAVTLAVIALVSLIPNLPWLYATVLYHDGYTDNITQNLVDAKLIWQELIGRLHGNSHGSKVYPLLVLGTLAACIRPGPPRQRGIWVALLAAAVALQLLAYLGATIPSVGKIQPNRFAPAGYLLLCIPAAQGFAAMVQTLADKAAGAWRYIVGVLLAAAFCGATVVVWELWREITPGPQGRYGAPPPQVRPLGEDSAWVLDWLEHRTSPDARVLFENSFARVHDQAHMAGYYAYRSQREFIGGPYLFMGFATAWDNVAFGKRLKDIPIERMREYLALYNIGAILVHSDGAKAYFDRMPGVRADAEHGVLRGYTVDGDHSYFLTGIGRIQERGHNRVLISNIAGPEIVLKYHYVPGMVTDPPTRIDGVRMLDDPKPFVRIVDPPAELRLHLK